MISGRGLKVLAQYSSSESHKEQEYHEQQTPHWAWQLFEEFRRR
jgi:hypothetical protein